MKSTGYVQAFIKKNNFIICIQLIAIYLFPLILFP